MRRCWQRCTEAQTTGQHCLKNQIGVDGQDGLPQPMGIVVWDLLHEIRIADAIPKDRGDYILSTVRQVLTLRRLSPAERAVQESRQLRYRVKLQGRSQLFIFHSATSSRAPVWLWTADSQADSPLERCRAWNCLAVFS